MPFLGSTNSATAGSVTTVMQGGTSAALVTRGLRIVGMTQVVVHLRQLAGPPAASFVLSATPTSGKDGAIPVGEGTIPVAPGYLNETFNVIAHRVTLTIANPGAVPLTYYLGASI